MNKSTVIILQIVIVLIGVGALVLLLWEPHLEGRNAHATLWQIYFNDPFLAYAYVASSAFFISLFQIYKLLRYAGQNRILSRRAVQSVQIVKYCALSLIGFIAVPVIYLFVIRPEDDIAGGVAVGFFLIAVFVVMAALTARVEKHLQNAVNR